MPIAQVETRVRLSSGEFVSVEQGQELPATDPVVREHPAVFGIKPKPSKPSKATKKKGDA